MTEQKPKMKLPTLDDYLMPNGEIKIDKDDTLVDIPIKLIKDFPNHPFKVKDDEKMNDLVESVKERGVLYPLLVRPRSDGTYELISGHRRKRAAQKLNIDSVKCIVKDLTDDEATILMVDSNIQREEVLPSEKAFAYKMKYEALKNRRNLMRPLDTSLRPVVTVVRTDDLIGEENGESGRQIQRYIRLTYLIPELLEKVDSKEIAFRPAVELSYLSKEEQEDLFDYIDCNQTTPSLSQAIKLKKMSLSGELDVDVLEELLNQEKPNQIQKIKFNESKIKSVLPKNIERDKIEDYVVKSIDYYTKYLNRQRERESR